MPALLQLLEKGLYCAAGDFYIDPMRGVERALVTHAHSDHARPGSRNYLTSATGAPLLRMRVGGRPNIEGLPFGQARTINGVQVSFHPAGHILGSAQVRVEHQGEVWVVGGDYNTWPDSASEPFEPVRCHTFVSESTFALPIYRWRPEGEIVAEINQWWQANAALRRPSIIFAYSLGKAQRLLAAVERSIGPLVAHETVAQFLPAYAAGGIAVPNVRTELQAGDNQALIIAPFSVRGTPWLEPARQAATAFASGWMQLRGMRHRMRVERGFALSDHADWGGLQAAIRATGAERILVTHGYDAILARCLREQGLDASRLESTPVPNSEAPSDATAQAPENLPTPES